MDADALGQTLRRWEQERDLSGAVLVKQGGRTAFQGCYGLADRAAGLPVTPRTRFSLASVTKLFTAVAVADLVAQGKLAFDTPVTGVLPPERRPSTLRSDVTVHHLLCHTSGIADYCEEDEDTPGYLADYGSLWDERPGHRMLGPADFLPLFGNLPPYRPPGLRHQYSNAGYVVLGLVVEEVTGRRYVDVVQDRVFDRAGMAASGFFRLDDAIADVAVGYLPRESPDAPWRSNIYRLPVIGGADGGAFSTTGDLDRFLTVLGDGSLLGPVHDVVMSRHADAGPTWGQGYGPLLHPDGRFLHEGGDPGVEAVVWGTTRGDGERVVVLCNGEGHLDDVYDLVRTALAR